MFAHSSWREQEDITALRMNKSFNKHLARNSLSQVSILAIRKDDYGYGTHDVYPSGRKTDTE